MAKVRQKLGKNYIHTNDHRIQSIIIDALAAAGFDVDIEITNNGHNEVVSCEIFDTGGGRKVIKNNRTAMRAYKKTQEKHRGKQPRCVVCGRIVDPEAHDAEYVRTKRKSHIFVHSGCVKNWGKG